MKKTFVKILSLAAICMMAVVGVAGCGKINPTSVLDIKPEKYISVGDYYNLGVAMENTYTVDEDMLNYYTNYYYGMATDYVDATGDNLDTSRAVKNGDMIKLDYAGYKDGVAFDGGTAANQTLHIGSGTFIPGFEEGLVGVKPGDTVDLNLKFPDNYGMADLAGAEVVFTVTVHGIIKEEAIVESWNNNLLGMPGASSSFEDIRQYVYDYLDENNRINYEADLQSAYVSAVGNIITVNKEFPESLIKSYQASAKEALETYAASNYTDTETLAQQVLGMTASDYIYKQSYEQLKSDAALYIIAQREGLVLTDEQFEQRFNELLTSIGYTAEEAAELDKNNYRMYFIEEDVMDFLISNNPLAQ